VDAIKNFSAGGMPNRVKCLHALVAHSLAVGEGINPIGDLVLDKISSILCLNMFENMSSSVCKLLYHNYKVTRFYFQHMIGIQIVMLLISVNIQDFSSIRLPTGKSASMLCAV
jgi:hypothetical protein